MTDISTIDWDALRAPFNPNDVDFRIQSNFEQGGKSKAVVIAYMDARLVQNRLDEVVGPENWSFDWTPVITKNDVVTVAKGVLTICGIPKSDVGDAGPTEPTKSTVSDALKRSAVMWGIGRYLYDLGTSFCETEQRGKSPAIPDAELKRMRSMLPKPKSASAAPVQQQAQAEVQRPVPPQQPTQRTTVVPPAAAPTPQPRPNGQTGADAMVTDRQTQSIKKLCAALQRTLPDFTVLTFPAARELLTTLSHDYSEARHAAVAS